MNPLSNGTIPDRLRPPLPQDWVSRPTQTSIAIISTGYAVISATGHSTSRSASTSQTLFGWTSEFHKGRYSAHCCSPCTAVRWPTSSHNTASSFTSMPTTHSFNSQLYKPTTRTRFADRAFRCAAPTVWNSLAADITTSCSLTVFKSKLKTHIFRQVPVCNQVLQA